MDCNAVGIFVKCKNGKQIDYILGLDNEEILFVAAEKEVFENVLSIGDVIKRFCVGFYDDCGKEKAFSRCVRFSDHDNKYREFIKEIKRLTLNDIEYIGLYHDISLPGERQYQWVKYSFPSGEKTKTGLVIRKESSFYYPEEYAPPYMAQIFETDGHIERNTTDFLIEAGVLKKYMGSDENVIVPDGVIKIEDNAFSGCYNLKSVTIPEGVTEIGGIIYGSFEKCYKLTDVTLPQSLIRLGHHAFGNCSSLTHITLPDSLTSIGNSVFFECSSLTDIALPDSVMSIGRSAFAGCRNLTSIKLPESITSIGEETFEGCYNLSSITLPECVSSIAKYAFAGCDLTDIVIPNGVTSIEEYTFLNCSRLTTITLPDGITNINKCAFYKCRNLTSITLPESITSIGESAFEGCKSLATINMPASLIDIGPNAFKDTAYINSKE